MSVPKFSARYIKVRVLSDKTYNIIAGMKAYSL